MARRSLLSGAMKKVVLVLLAAFAAFAIFQWLTFPDVETLATEPPETTAFMERRERDLRSQGKDPSIDYRWVSYERISPNLRAAVIVSEDSRFWEHEGVDTEELRKIAEESWEKRGITRGGSTITQQLAKNLYLSPSRNPWRKVKELLIARQLEKTLDKKRILEIYLNVVELGERVYGAEAASRHYFGKSASALSAGEAALLAGALPNPRTMNPGNPGPYLRSRQKIITSRMYRWGGIAEERALAADTHEPSDPGAAPDLDLPETVESPEPDEPNDPPTVDTLDQPVPDPRQPATDDDSPIEPAEPAEGPPAPNEPTTASLRDRTRADSPHSHVSRSSFATATAFSIFSERSAETSTTTSNTVRPSST